MKKISNKILLIGLAVLIVIFAASRLFRSPKLESNLRKELLKLDTASISEVRILPTKDHAEEIRLHREGLNWKVIKGQRREPTSRAAVQGVLGTLIDLQAQRMVSRKKEKWEEYNVGTNSTHVTVFSGDKKIADFHVGKIGFAQSEGRMMGGTYTYVRMSDENEVYAVEGFLQPTFDNAYNDWRDKTFLKLNKEDIQEVAFTYPADSGFVLTKRDSVWYVNAGAAELSKINPFLSRMSNTYLTEFVDEFKPASKPEAVIRVSGKSGNLVTVECWKNESGWVLTSSIQKGIYFSDKGSSVVKEILIGKKKLLHNN